MAKKSGVWNLQQVRDKQLQSLWDYSTPSGDSGSLWTWGRNYAGWLGHNQESTEYSSPVQIPGNWTKVSKGYQDYMMFATKSDGTMWAWGYGLNGSLGLNQSGPSASRSSPTQVPGTNWGTPWGVGELAAFATKTNGTLWAWGYNQHGALGLNGGHQEAGQKSSPTQLPGTTWSTDEHQNAGGLYFALSVKTDGTLYSWGKNDAGGLGQNNKTDYSSPVQIPGTTWSKVAAADASSFGIKTDGSLWSWGKAESGYLGQDNTTWRSSPVQVGSDTTWSSIDGGYQTVAAIKTDGTLWMWGKNEEGQLGQNSKTYYSSPRQIPGTTWSKINVSRYYSLSTKTDGTLWSWGQNANGYLGHNNETKYSSPVQVGSLTDWTSVSASYSTAIAMKIP